MLQADDGKLLRAIAIVESNADHEAIGDRGKAVGAWQMHEAAWDDANRLLAVMRQPTYPRPQWRNKTAQKAIAGAYLEVIRAQLERRGILNPTPAQLALCWNCGTAGAARRGFRPSDYSNKVLATLSTIR
jgi:hypothetical protein